jgi:hypothetical protein
MNLEKLALVAQILLSATRKLMPDSLWGLDFQTITTGCNCLKEKESLSVKKS